MWSSSNPQAGCRSERGRHRLPLFFLLECLVPLLIAPVPSGAADASAAPIYRNDSLLLVWRQAGSVRPDRPRHELVRLGKGENLVRRLAELRRDPRVAHVEPNGIARIAAVPNDPRYSEQWHLPAIAAEQAWDRATDCSQAVIALIDTGLDLDHPDLAANLWSNPGETPGDGADNDGNGFVDDVNGYDFVANDSRPDDENGHGSHVAGIAAAVGNNGRGVAGLCWTARLLPLRFLDRHGYGSTSNAIRSVDYVADLARRFPGTRFVLSNSWTIASYSALLEQALGEAAQAGVLITAAAGNEGRDNTSFESYPGNFHDDLDPLLSVANLAPDGGLEEDSNYGLTRVDLAAPGTGILSTYDNGGYTSLTGTSMAAPLVSGLAALAWQQDPGLSASAVKASLMAATASNPKMAGRTITGGAIHAGDTLDRIGQPVSALFRLETPAGGGVRVHGFGMAALQSIGLNGETLDCGDVQDAQADCALPPTARNGLLVGHWDGGDTHGLYLRVGLAAPDEVTAVPDEDGGAILSWNAPANAVQIEIERAPSGSASYARIATVDAAPGTYRDTSVAANSSYKYRLRARYPYLHPARGEQTQYSAYSDIVSFAAGAVDGAPPQWLTQVLGTARQGEPYRVRLRARDADGAALSYRLVSGDLPDGLALAEDGWISGTPAAEGSHEFLVAAATTRAASGSLFTLTVAAAGSQPESTLADGQGEVYGLVATPGAVQGGQLRKPDPAEREVLGADAAIVEFDIGIPAGEDDAASFLVDLTLGGESAAKISRAWLLHGTEGWRAPGAEVSVAQRNLSLPLDDGGAYDGDPAEGRLSVGVALETTAARAAAGDSRCFIASAVYADRRHPDVEALRAFRDRVLLKWRLGRQAVAAYYRHSPAWAQWLSERPALRIPLRAMLAAAALAVRHPVGTAAAVALLGFVLLALGRGDFRARRAIS